MNLLQDRRVQLAGGAGAAVLAGAVIAALVMGRDRPPTQTPPAKGALQVELGEQPRVDPSQSLRCFVGGQFIGMATLADCAQKNGVAAQALDVGLDESGALAAGGDSLKPLAPVAPPVQVALAPPPAPALVGQVQAPNAAGASTGECLRYGPEGWRPTGGALSLPACAQLLFEGHCQRPGEALYGRWSGQTLRLVPGRVETSADNRTFHTLVEQNRDCSLPSL
ncbi:MAG TPA: hypothetical protein VL460_02695 [Caulobacteraceae bacterium]|jgi:hypothetical protein|nr:hypothetical protein [Caulobacteraceae bacterium]